MDLTFHTHCTNKKLSTVLLKPFEVKTRIQILLWGSTDLHLHPRYIANCTSGPSLVCLGKQVFSKRVECNWTEGYSWTTALVLSVTLGGFGADRSARAHT